MGIFDKFKSFTATDRLSEEKLYEQVAQELKAGKKREGIWVKAMSKTGGDLNKAGALYIELRVQAIKDEDGLALAQQERQVEAEKTSKRELEKSRKPLLTDFKINIKDIDNLAKAYSKASKNLLLGITAFYSFTFLLKASNIGSSNLSAEFDVLGVVLILLITFGIMIAGTYLILIIPRRYFVRTSNPKYLRVSKYTEALKKFEKLNFH